LARTSVGRAVHIDAVLAALAKKLTPLLLKMSNDLIALSCRLKRKVLPNYVLALQA
jgi:hypothetical protein